MRPERGGQSGPALEGFEVDLRSLKDFAALMRGEVDANLRPHGQRIISDQVHGVCFGALSASSEVQAARRVYHACLVQSVETMRSYVEASENLVTAVQKVAADYADVDALSAQRADGVAADLMAAMGEARQKQIEAQERAAAAIAEEGMRRRLERMQRWE